MKLRKLFIALLLVSVLLSACGTAETETPVVTKFLRWSKTTEEPVVTEDTSPNRRT